MKKIIALLVVLFLPITASSTIRTLTSADLPYSTQANNDTLRISGTKISNAGGGITINHTGIVIDGQNDTLLYGASNANGAVGVYINNANSKIQNLWLIQDGEGSTCDGVKLSHSARGVIIDKVNFIARGVNGQCVDSYGSGTYAHSVVIDSCHFWNYCDSYDNRMHYDGAAIRLELRNPSLGPSDFSAKIRYSVIHTSPHAGIAIFGKSGDMLLKDLEIAYCSTYVDHQNQMYPVFDGTTGHSSANAYGILISYADGGLRVHNNYIGAGIDHGGSRGLMLEGIDGSPTDTAKIYDNYIDIHCGPDVNYAPARNNYVSSWAVRIRDIDDGTGEYLEFYDNFVRITLDTTSQVGDAYGYWGTAINLSETKTHDGHMNIYNNHFETAVLNTRSNTEGDGIRFMATPYDRTIKVFNNRIIAPTRVVFFYSGSGIDMTDNVIEYASQTNNPRAYYMGYWNGDNTRNHIYDAVYLNGADGTDMAWAPNGSADIALHKTINVFVRGDNGLPVAGADVTITNNYGQTVAGGTSNGNGIFDGVVTYHFESRTGTDSTNYNNFSVKVKMGSDSTIVSHTVSDNSELAPVVLENTSGETGDDTTAPNNINDLSLYQTAGSSVTVTWTAPGDDGQSGTADAYDLRYSTSAISDANWFNATQVVIPGPKVAGSSETATITNLNEGSTYFFAVRTRDELHNWSGISNVISAQLSDQYAPSAITDLRIINVTDGNFSFAWTATGDDGNSGTASSYDIRYSSSLITSQNWAGAQSATGEPIPQISGTTQTFSINGLTPDQTYYFAMRCADDAGNLSGLSNVAAGGDVNDNTAPDAIADLKAVSGFNSGDIELDWSAVGDDGSTGIASGYQIKYSSAVINAGNWNSAASYAGSPTPLSSGQNQSFTLSGLVPGQIYYVAVKAYDDNGNFAPISNVVSATAQSGFTLGESSVAIVGPTNNSVVKNLRPTLVVENISAAANTYMFEVSESALMSSPIVSETVNQMAGDITSYQVEIDLEQNTTYYWRVTANIDDYSEVTQFMVAPQTHAYPNPFIMSEIDYATFTDIPPNSNLLIMSVSGSTVRHWFGVVEGEIRWDGTNLAGEQVASGTYIWFLEGTDISDKIVVKR